MAERNIGKITQIIGAVLDVKYAEGQLPEINEAIEITRSNGEKLVVIAANDLAHYMECANCADSLVAIGDICDKNLVPDDATFTKAVLVDDSKVKFIKEATKQNTFSKEAAELVGLLENLQSNGIKIVTKHK